MFCRNLRVRVRVGVRVRAAVERPARETGQHWQYWTGAAEERQECTGVLGVGSE